MEHSIDPKTIGVFNLEYRGDNGIVGYIGCRIPTALLPKTPLPDFEAIIRKYLKVAWDKMTRHELFEDVKTTVTKWLGSDEFDLTLTEEPGFDSPLFAKPMTLEYIGIPKPKPNIREVFERVAEDHREVFKALADYDERQPDDTRDLELIARKNADVSSMPKYEFDRKAIQIENELRAAQGAQMKFEKASPPQTPFIGQIVHFRVDGRSNPFPAIIVAIKQDGKVDLNVFHNYNSFGHSDLIIECDAPYDPSGVSGSWRFIPSR